MSNFIYWEVLTGDIDGVNKVFYASNSIDSIESLRIAWAEYTLFSFNSNRVVLQDAPEIWMGQPSIDYWKVSLTPPIIASWITFGELIDDVYDDIGQDRTSSQYPLRMVERRITEGLRVVANMKVNSLRKKSSYSFNKAIDTTLSSYSTSELNVGTIPTYCPTFGKVIIGRSEIVSYTSVTSSSFQWISGLDIIYKAWDNITIGYQIPTGVKKISEVIVDGRNLPYKDRSEYQVGVYGYTIIDGYLFLPRTSYESVVTVNFVMDNVSEYGEDDVVDFHEDYSQVIRLYALVQLYWAREDDRIGNIVKLYEDSLKKYKSYISRQVEGINNTLQVKGFNRTWR